MMKHDMYPENKVNIFESIGYNLISQQPNETENGDSSKDNECNEQVFLFWFQWPITPNLENRYTK